MDVVLAVIVIVIVIVIVACIIMAGVFAVGYAALSDDVGDLAPVLCVSGEGAGT